MSSRTLKMLSLARDNRDVSFSENGNSCVTKEADVTAVVQNPDGLYTGYLEQNSVEIIDSSAASTSKYEHNEPATEVASNAHINESNVMYLGNAGVSFENDVDIPISFQEQNGQFQIGGQAIQSEFQNDCNEDRMSLSSSLSRSSSSSSYIEDSDDSVADPTYEVDDSSSHTRRMQVLSNLDKNLQKEDNQKRKVKHPCRTEKTGKKRIAKPDQWIKNQAKRARNSGQAYISSSSKKTFQERKLLPPCKDNCRLKCVSKFTESDRQQIFGNYWGLADLERQRSFLLSSMSEIKPKYRYVKENGTRDRSHNNAFYFEKNGHQKVQVCKTFFKATLGINDRPIRTVLKKRTYFTGNMISADFRGKHGNHAKIDEKVKDGVRSHINSIPRIPSHYCRAGSSREFIEGGKSLAEIHRDYEKLCKEKNEPAANYMMYSRIFNEQFNISFFLPKKDQCDLCVGYLNSNDAEKANLEAEYQVHLKEAKLARIEKEQDKNSQNTVVAVFDLQAVLPCPSGQTSAFYYVSKLSVFNLTVYDLKSKQVNCFVWHEAEAHRGSNEIGSCIMRYLDKVEERAAEDCNEVDVIFFSDNCAGQQKNKFLVATYFYLISKYKYIKSITHKFLVTGHSQNEGDNAHSVIERQISRFKRSAPIYTPEQYYSLIRCAKKSGEPYQLTEISHDDIYDLKSLTNDLGYNNASRTEEGDIFKLSDVKVLKIERGNIGKLFYKYSFGAIEFRIVNVIKNRRTDFNINEVSLKKAFKKRPGINKSKKNSLLSLFKGKKKPVPMTYFPFYNNL